MIRAALPRIRELVDATGLRLRVTLQAQAGEPVVLIARPDLDTDQVVRLDLAAADVLCGYLLAARLSGRQQLADEETLGRRPALFSLEHEPIARVEIRAHVLDGEPVSIPATLWDRLYAELCIVAAHGRALDARAMPAMT